MVWNCVWISFLLVRFYLILKNIISSFCFVMGFFVGNFIFNICNKGVLIGFLGVDFVLILVGLILM